MSTVSCEMWYATQTRAIFCIVHLLCTPCSSLSKLTVCPFRLFLYMNHEDDLSARGNAKKDEISFLSE